MLTRPSGMRIERLCILCLALMPAACTWVELDNDALGIALLPHSEVAQCELLGTTISTTRDKVGLLNRDDEKVAMELLTLAKNSAASMGGDTLVEQTPVSEGKQTFGVYDCHRHHH
jgi:hypothetical protein